MSTRVKDGTLKAADNDKWLDQNLAKLVRTQYPGIGGATIQTMMDISRKSVTWWGKIKPCSEEAYLLYGCDIVLTLNEDLWESLDDDGKTGLLAHFLSMIERNGEQQTEKGKRAIFAAHPPLMSIDPEVIARHPSLLTQLDELAQWNKAAMNPTQYLLDLQGGMSDLEVKTTEQALVRSASRRREQAAAAA